MRSNIRYKLYLLKQSLKGFLSSIVDSIRPHFYTGKKKLLIVKLDSIGDYLLFRNFLQVIRESERFRDFEITLCGNSLWKDISEKHDKKYVDHFLWLSPEEMKDEQCLTKLCSSLRDRKFTIALTPTYSRSWHTDQLILGSGAGKKIAPAGDSVNISADQKKNNDRRYSRLIEQPDALAFEFERYRTFFATVLRANLSHVNPVFVSPGTRHNKIVICPGAKAAVRQWAPHNFSDLCEYLHSQVPDYEFYICGSPSEKPIAQEMLKRVGRVRFTDLCGTQTLSELQDFISASKLVICNDSAPYHMAVFLEIPVICISNGNHYGRFCPYPQTYQKKQLVSFPPSLRIPPATDEIRDLQQNGSAYDINEITTEQVIVQLKDSNFLYDLIHHNR